jgi:hypothetical protein
MEDAKRTQFIDELSRALSQVEKKVASKKIGHQRVYQFNSQSSARPRPEDYHVPQGRAGSPIRASAPS